MTTLKIPPELKKITQYIRRAEELTRDAANPESRLVAYYCRQYAVQTGISLANSPEGRSCLGSILDTLDVDKVAMSNFTKEESYGLCRSFALRVFDKADTEDRDGRSGKSTAKTFYAAASFLDVLKQFKEEQGRGEEEATEEEKKSFYAKWKATDILKAIREGKEPTPGGYAEAGTNSNDENDEKEEKEEGDGEAADDEKALAELIGLTQANNTHEEGFEVPAPNAPSEEGFEVPAPNAPAEEVLPPPSLPDDEDSFVPLAPPPPPSYPTTTESNNTLKHAATFDRPPMNTPSIPNIHSMPTKPVTTQPKKSSTFGNMFKKPSSSSTPKRGSITVSKDAMNDAKELAKFAMRALDAKDVDLAVERFQEVLRVLGH